MGRQRFFDPKYIANPWEFTKKFTALYLSPTSTNFYFLRYQFYFRFGVRAPSPSRNFFWCFIGCEIANLARDQFKICTLGPPVKKGWITLVYLTFDFYNLCVRCENTLTASLIKRLTRMAWCVYCCVCVLCIKRRIRANLGMSEGLDGCIESLRIASPKLNVEYNLHMPGSDDVQSVHRIRVYICVIFCTHMTNNCCHINSKQLN